MKFTSKLQLAALLAIALALPLVYAKAPKLLSQEGPKTKKLTSLRSARMAAFVATTNAAKAREFYEDVLGLRFVGEDPYAVVFDANGTRLRVQKVKEFTPHPFTALGWTVTDISSKIKELRLKGVTFLRPPGIEQDELGIWSFSDGTKVAWFKDPDGNILSLAQFKAQKVKSEE